MDSTATQKPHGLHTGTQQGASATGRQGQSKPGEDRKRKRRDCLNYGAEEAGDGLTLGILFSPPLSLSLKKALSFRRHVSLHAAPGDNLGEQACAGTVSGRIPYSLVPAPGECYNPSGSRPALYGAAFSELQAA